MKRATRRWLWWLSLGGWMLSPLEGHAQGTLHDELVGTWLYRVDAFDWERSRSAPDDYLLTLRADSTWEITVKPATPLRSGAMDWVRGTWRQAIEQAEQSSIRRWYLRGDSLWLVAPTPNSLQEASLARGPLFERVAVQGEQLVVGERCGAYALTRVDPAALPAWAPLPPTLKPIDLVGAWVTRNTRPGGASEDTLTLRADGVWMSSEGKGIHGKKWYLAGLDTVYGTGLYGSVKDGNKIWFATGIDGDQWTVTKQDSVLVVRQGTRYPPDPTDGCREKTPRIYRRIAP